MEPLTQPAIDDNRLIHPGFDWFFDALEEFLQALENRLVQIENGDAPHGIPQTNGQPCGVCNLTFYFYFSPGGGFQNGIWIDVDNINKLDIWLRIGFNDKGKKKVDIYSKFGLNCNGIFMNYVAGYSLPFDFNDLGVFKTGGNVHPCSFDDILNEICNLMPCLCLGDCV